MQRKGGVSKGGVSKGSTELIEPLDSDEQEQVVEDLRTQVTKQSKRWRIAFATGYVIIAVIFLACGIYGSFFPWKFHHQYIFANHLHFSVFQCYYFLSFIVFAFSAKFILVNEFLNFVIKCINLL
jgi:hypothetical protein